MNLPTREQCLELLHKNHTPQNIIEHCEAVSRFAASVADKLQKKSIKVNRQLVEAGAMLHDIEKLKPDHELRGSEFVRDAGYQEAAEIVRTHGLSHLDNSLFSPKSIEQKLVFYAD